MKGKAFLLQHTDQAPEPAKSEGDHLPELILEVMPENYEAVQVYAACAWDIFPIVGKHVVFHYQDIRAQEILSGCQLLNVPQDKWGEIAVKISGIMVPAAKEVLNNPDGVNRRQTEKDSRQ